MLTTQDKQDIEKIGINVENIERQLDRFAKGFPFLKLKDVAIVGNGITRFSEKECYSYIRKWKKFDGKIAKFVPASGAASRMFKNMFAFVASGRTEPETDFEKQFFDEINKFAFYGLLNKACVKLYEKNVHELIEEKRYVDVVKAMLEREGLDYGELPKALIKFHKTAAGGVHTPVEEHLEEGAQYAADQQRNANIHFTVSPEHRDIFTALLKEKLPDLEKVWGVKYNISMSEQMQSTNTIAVNTDNTPFRDAQGQLVFRPAGHGALLENLNKLDADVVFIKNIDNVVPLKLRNATVHYKKIIAGYLIELQQKIALFLNELDKPEHDATVAQAALKFIETKLSTVSPATALMNEAELEQYIRTKLNRPIRVCGMVKNEGEPGGGPYLAYNKDGSYSPQILEAAQIDGNDAKAVELMKSGTHFNPVDLVCYLKDYKGNKFELSKFVDPSTGLISEKSKDGKALKALELPGLWNGAMSDWNTAFVEVPIETFNPVKTVNDLLRKQHQG